MSFDESSIIHYTAQFLQYTVENLHNPIIFTDLFGGSVNNEFMKYISNPQIRLIAGMNLALVITAMSIVEMKNNAAEVEEELLGIADSVINFCSRTGIDSLEDDEF